MENKRNSNGIGIESEYKYNELESWSSWLKIITRLILWIIHIFILYMEPASEVYKELCYLQLIQLEAGYGRLPCFVLPFCPVTLVTLS